MSALSSEGISQFLSHPRLGEVPGWSDAANSVRYASRGYALPLKDAVMAPGGEPAPWGNRGWPLSLNGFLERKPE